MSEIKHVAIIMDGNGRWATSRRHRRFWGHIKGSSVVSDIVEAADDIGLKALTLFAFSSENWSRPLDEISVLFKLLKKYIIKERRRIIKNNIRFKVIGNIDHLPQDSKDLVHLLEEDTKDNQGLILNFAFGYGGRMEIANAVNTFIKENPGKEITEEDISQRMFCAKSGDVDLLIRTGGDQRISNFLLWQCAYAELFFCSTLWPDFSDKAFINIVEEARGRERRFGGVGAQQSMSATRFHGVQNKEIISSSQDSHV